MDFFVHHIVTVGKGISSEGDEDSTTTWTDWTVGRETEGACYHDTYTLATHYRNVSTLYCNCIYVVTSNVVPPIYCKNIQQRGMTGLCIKVFCQRHMFWENLMEMNDMNTLQVEGPLYMHAA